MSSDAPTQGNVQPQAFPVIEMTTQDMKHLLVCMVALLGEDVDEGSVDALVHTSSPGMSQAPRRVARSDAVSVTLYEAEPLNRDNEIISYCYEFLYLLFNAYTRSTQ